VAVIQRSLVRRAAVVACGLAIVMTPSARAAAPPDSLLPLVQRMNRYFRQHLAEGVTMDSRYSVSPSEAIRQSVVCQALGYAELQKLHPVAGLAREVETHADYLIAHLDPIRSHTPFDGMLALSLVEAWRVTRAPRFLGAARDLMDEVEAIPTSECILNGGLMVAMATADAAQEMNDAVAATKTHDILAQLSGFQNDDGSFPHWCPGSEDIHYTGWMAQELNHIERLTHDPLIPPILDRMRDFLEGRVDAIGHSQYEGPCPGVPSCTQYYYSRASGCAYDYDSRGWTVEPGYIALLFDRYRSPKLGLVMAFLDSLEHGGTMPDLYGWWPPPSDPEYPWTVADTSVANMSIAFWSLASIVTQRAAAGDLTEADLAAAIDADLDCSGPPPPPPPPPPPAPTPIAFGTVLPNPARTDCRIAVTLAAPAHVSLVIYDARGRRERVLVDTPLDAGEHLVAWDLRDDAGRASRSGLYFARFDIGGAIETRRIVVTR
jgi:hypothetical protein